MSQSQFKFNLNADAGLPGDSNRRSSTIQPRAVMQMSQLQLGTRRNIVPSESGARRPNLFPMQEMTPTRGGQHSGRTGPMFL
jgi:hypothetical protein